MVPDLLPSAVEHGQLRPRGGRRVTAQHTLERVRNNQRRHRAQRREYTAMLELKLTRAEQQIISLKTELAQYQKQDGSHSLLGRLEQREGPPAPQPSPSGNSHMSVNTIDRGTVTHCSPPLLQLLPHSSLRGPELVDAVSLHSASDEIGGGALRPLVPVTYSPDHPRETTPGAAGGGAECSSCSCNMLGAATQRASQRVGHSRPWLSPAVEFHLDLGAAEPCCSSSQPLHPESLATGDHGYGFNPARSPPRSPVQAYGHASANESTMPCAEAYILIEQQNFKGVHQKDVASWLWTGFRMSPNPAEGCRVKTDLLFSLLTFISET